MPMLATWVRTSAGYFPAVVYNGTWYGNYAHAFEDIEQALAEAIAWAAKIREDMRS